MAHVNFDCLKKMISKNTVRGIKVKNMPNSIDCETCAKGKIAVKAFPQESQTRPSKLLELIHSDVCGPMNIKSCGGARYFVTFIDGYSRYIHVYFIKSKDEVFNVFKMFKNEVENQTDNKIKCIRTDNGCEYLSKAFEQFLSDNGIKRQLTVPHTPQQNGVSERANRTLCEMARTMIIEAAMPESFWAEAVRTAAYIRNRTTTKVLPDKTPHEMWYKFKPAVGHLKTFGAKAVVLDKTAKKKFAAKGMECVMVGYSEVSKAYRLYNPEKRKVITARDVVFFEDSTCNRNEGQQAFFSDGSERVELFELPVSAQDEASNAEEDSAEILISQGDAAEEGAVAVMHLGPESLISHGDAAEEGDKAKMHVGPGRPKIIRTGSRGRPRKQYNILQNIGEYTVETPETDVDALRSPYADDWQNSMKSEYESLMKNNTWELANLPKGQVAIGCRWVYAVKRDKDGGVQKFKSRLVAKGCSQRFGVNYHETFSPVVRYANIRLVVALAVEYGIYLHQMDVSSAYLNSELHDTVYMKQPPHFVDEKHPDKVLKLKKSLYGLKQSGREWNSTLDKSLKKLGFQPCVSDPCIYTQRQGSCYSIILVYVDDIIVGSTSLKKLNKIKNDIGSEFECVDGGELSHFLGMEFHRDGELGSITVSQKQYVLNALQQMGMQDCKEASTPLEPGYQVSCSDEKCAKVDVTEYQSAIGVLMYLGLSTRPDILLSVTKLAQRNCNPHSEHWAAVKHIFRYLKKTAEFKLHYHKTGQPIECHVDADWAGDLRDRKSFSGYVFVVAGCVFAWSARKQSLVALSSTEAEYVAISMASTEAVYIRKLVDELGFPENGPMTIYNDNQSAQCLVRNPSFHSRSKHIAIKYHHVRDMHLNKEVEVKYMPTEKMMSDILTKNLSKIKHFKFTQCMGLH